MSSSSGKAGPAENLAEGSANLFCAMYIMNIKRITFYDWIPQLYSYKARLYRHAKTELAKARLWQAMRLDAKQELADEGFDTFTKDDAIKKDEFIRSAAEAKGLFRLWFCMKFIPGYLDD